MTRKKLSALILFGLCLTPAAAFASETYEIDPDHTGASFAIKHLMVSSVRGDFSGVQGVVKYDESNPANSSVEATIDTTTIDTRNKKRDDHLRSPDFFDAKQFPVMKFKSTKVESAGPGKLKVTGDLSMRGMTKEVSLDVEEVSPAIKDPWGNTKRGATATAKLSRKDFGLTWNKALETGGVVVGDDVTITIDVEMTKKS